MNLLEGIDALLEVNVVWGQLRLYGIGYQYKF